MQTESGTSSPPVKILTMPDAQSMPPFSSQPRLKRGGSERRRLCATLLGLGLPGVLGVKHADATIQSWEDPDSIHLSNIGAPPPEAELIGDPIAEPPRITLTTDAPEGGAPAGGGPDLRRLIAHDAKTAERLARYAPMVTLAASQHGVDPALLHAVVAVESAYNPSARSRKGAIGLMQVLPATGARFGVARLEDPLENLKAGSLYLRQLLQLFHENIPLTVAAYNAGEHAVQQYGNRIPPYPETLRYVPQVIGIYQGLLQ